MIFFILLGDYMSLKYKRRRQSPTPLGSPQATTHLAGSLRHIRTPQRLLL